MTPQAGQNSGFIMMKMALAASILALSMWQPALAAPDCSNAISDTDNDGWGWEFGQSCRFAGDDSASPAPAAQCIDTDPVGDGWGWDGVSSCRVAETLPPEPVVDLAPPVATCVDTDPVGDGWGWDGVSSCRVADAAVAAPAATAAIAAACIDTDPVGDGWGWDGAGSCRVVEPAQPEPVEPAPLVAACIDTDPVGDGWGWDGANACEVIENPATAVDFTEPDFAAAATECVDTDPLGDGWGWNGTSSCRLEPPVGTGVVQAQPVNTAQRWARVTSADNSHATGRHESGAVAVNDKIYLLGGRGDRPVEVYDRSANKWYQVGNLPMEMHHFQPVALNGKIYVLGAMTCCFPNESTIDNVWVMDASSGSWEVGAAIPANRRRGSAAAVVFNNRIYLVGGNTKGHSGGAVAWFDEFNPANGQWRTLADAPHARDHAGAAIVAGRLVIGSGRQSAQPDTFGNTVAATDVYDFATGRWSTAADIPTRRGGAMVAVVGGEFVVMGGESNAHYNAHAEVEAYDVSKGVWRSLPSLITGRHSGGAAVLSDGVHIMAGATTRGGGSEVNSHERLRFD